MFLSIKEVKEDKILFLYELNEIIEFIAEGVLFFKKKQLDIDSIEWNARKNEVTVDLKKD